jgi:erythromycin esterase-like protein
MHPWRIVVMTLGLVTAASAATLQDESAAAWVRTHAIPLTTVEANNGFNDLQPLKPLIGDARIVSLGEATHGSREIFQLKHRLIEFLASEMGFTIFAIEANMPEAYRVNDYVLNGTGDPAQLLRGMYFWTWDTEEVLTMIKWMRAFNQSGKGRIEFTGFDMQTPTVAVDLARQFVAENDPAYLATFADTADLVARSGASANAFGVATGKFPVTVAAGKKVRFSGYIKTDRVSEGFAGLWWRVDGEPGTRTLAFDNMNQRGPRGTTDWTRYVIELPVDPNARNINFGLLMPGNGTAWFDDLTIELDGQPYVDPTLFDLGFESRSPVGFYTGGNGYTVALDPTVAHGGEQSLRMSRNAAQSTSTSVDRAKIATTWKDVVDHLETARPAYRSKGISDGAIDWAVQNARIVLQGLQMQLNTVSRDRSMADNIEWIADHNPNEKIVIWAHNGHVRKVSAGVEPMGARLRTRYRDKLFVFGSAFSAGSFQAIPMGGGTLKNFTVPPAPAGSLDATLSTAGIPAFAIDLRQSPDWFRQPHASRHIGAMYPDGEPYAFLENIIAPDAYDAILFIQQTTAARRNSPR